MTSLRRDVLNGINVQRDTHAGLWLDKYLEDDKDGSKDKLVHEVADIPTSEEYFRFFERWKTNLAEICGEKNCREAEVVGRLAVNLGSEAVLETSIALHHTYGVPYIPGSALKGLVTHYVLTYQDKASWGRESEAFKTLFGDTTSAGYVTFYDALYVPNSGKNRQALWKDVITVHHPEYYQGDKPPADWDSPTPIPFITATGKFLVALSGPPEWVKTAFEILELALEREGVGAKTSSGYGRMNFDGSASIGAGEKKSAVEHAPVLPPKGAEWKKGKISADGKAVHPTNDPTQKIPFHREHVLPKGFTPARKSEAEYTEELLTDGSMRVWVKQLYYPTG